MSAHFVRVLHLGKAMLGNFTYNTYNKFTSRSYHALFVQPPHDETPKETFENEFKAFRAEFGETLEFSPCGIAATIDRAKKMSEILKNLEIAPLPPRRMKDSYASCIIPLRNDVAIREFYVTGDHKVRVGRLLEVLDRYSAFCCLKHILIPELAGQRYPYVVVTAAVDNIRFAKDYMNPQEDIRITGHVTYAGKSSIEATMVVDQRDANNVYRKCFDAAFLYVARDPLGVSPVLVNPLVADTPEEKEFLKRGMERQMKRRAFSEDTVYKKPPNEEEIQIIHDHFIKRLIIPHGSVSSQNTKRMKDTELRNIIVCQPQNRNTYNKVFGGFIMRKAVELAFSSTLLYGKARPYIVNIDAVKFYTPIDIGTIVRFRSQVGYVENNFIHTFIVAEVIDYKTGKAVTSNEFHFTFAVMDCAEPPPALDYETYEDAMKFIIARRHFKDMINHYGTPSWLH